MIYRASRTSRDVPVTGHINLVHNISSALEMYEYFLLLKYHKFAVFVGHLSCLSTLFWIIITHSHDSARVL